MPKSDLEESTPHIPEVVTAQVTVMTGSTFAVAVVSPSYFWKKYKERKPTAPSDFTNSVE